MKKTKHVSYPRIFLVGLMGVGKSSVGRELASLLSIPFVDTDECVEAEADQSVSEIFQSHGEETFRRLERSAIARWVEKPSLVLATGGGAILSAQNREKLSARGSVVYLTAALETLLSRLQGDQQRPLLQQSDPGRVLLKLWQERDPLYRSIADYVISTEGNQPVEIALKIRQQWMESMEFVAS